MNHFLAELKRRRVVRAALVYIGAAFVVLQAADLFVEAFQLPPVVFATIGIASIVGLPVTLVLAWAFDVGPPDADREAAGLAPMSSRWLSVKSLIAIVVLVLAGVMLGLTPKYFLGPLDGPANTTVRRYEILLPDHAPIEFLGSSPLSVPTLAMAITPDGNQLIYAGPADGDTTQLYVRDLSEFEAHPLPGSKGAYAPFISPDGQSVGFFANDQLRVVPIDGGDARIIAETPNPLGGAWWGPDRIIFNDRESNEHWWVSVTDGTPTRLPIDQSEAPAGGGVGIGQEYQPLPDGERFLVLTTPGRIAAYAPATGSLQTVMDIPVNVRVASDTLVYAIGNDLLAVDFDATLAAISGDEWTVGSDLRRDGGIAQFVLSDRTLIYATGAPYGQRHLALVDLDGRIEPLDIPAARFSGAAFSPDGNKLAITIRENQLNIWLYDLGTLQRRKLTGGGNNFQPHWSGDGDSIYFSSDRAGNGQNVAIYRTPADGGPGDAVRVFERGAVVVIDKLHAGDLATTSQRSGEIGNDIFQIDLRNGDIRPLASRPDYTEVLGNLSPDGRWLAATVDATGRYEIIIMPADGNDGRRVQITTEGGEEPLWAPDMSEIYYRYGSKLYAVPITFENDRPVPGQPRMIFDDDTWQNLLGFSYWRNPADGRFLIQRTDQPSNSQSLRVVEGWKNREPSPPRTND